MQPRKVVRFKSKPSIKQTGGLLVSCLVCMEAGQRVLTFVSEVCTEAPDRSDICDLHRAAGPPKRPKLTQHRIESQDLLCLDLCKADLFSP